MAMNVVTPSNLGPEFDQGTMVAGKISNFPEMDTVTRDAISSPAAGMRIWNSDTNQMQRYDGSSWVEIGAGAVGGPWGKFVSVRNANLTQELNQVVATAIEWGFIEENQDAALFSIPSNRLIQVGEDGNYLVTYGVAFKSIVTGVASAVNLRSSIYVGGAKVSAWNYGYLVGSDGIFESGLAGSKVLSLSAGDQVNIRIQRNGGTSISTHHSSVLDSHFQVMRLS